MPQKPAGVVIEPHVSEPIAKPTKPAETADPDPLDEPPDQLGCSSAFQGEMPGPVSEIPTAPQLRAPSPAPQHKLIGFYTEEFDLD